MLTLNNISVPGYLDFLTDPSVNARQILLYTRFCRLQLEPYGLLMILSHNFLPTLFFAKSFRLDSRIEWNFVCYLCHVLCSRFMLYLEPKI